MGNARSRTGEFERVMVTSVIGVSGGIGSGKTTWSNRIAQELRFSKASFGDYLRKRLNTADREVLKEAGAKLVRSDPTAFVRNVLADAGWTPGGSIVLDGIRHVSILEAVREITSPGRVVLVFVDADDAERVDRLQQRGDESPLAWLDDDSTEADIPKLRRLADVVVSREVSVEEVIRLIEAVFSN